MMLIRTNVNVCVHVCGCMYAMCVFGISCWYHCRARWEVHSAGSQREISVQSPELWVSWLKKDTAARQHWVRCVYMCVHACLRVCLAFQTEISLQSRVRGTQCWFTESVARSLCWIVVILTQGSSCQTMLGEMLEWGLEVQVPVALLGTWSLSPWFDKHWAVTLLPSSVEPPVENASVGLRAELVHHGLTSMNRGAPKRLISTHTPAQPLQ